jgi:hypothetical protein
MLPGFPADQAAAQLPLSQPASPHSLWQLKPADQSASQLL